MGRLTDNFEERAQRERRALDNVCPCWYWDLAGAIDETDDETLTAIFNDPQYLHKQNQIHNPVSAEEYAEELSNCPESTRKVAT